jgi:hypothetical protein
MYTTIPAETSASDLAIQFDIYCPEPWDLTGQLEISLQNNLNGYGWGSAPTKYSAEYTCTATIWVPWLNTEDGSHTAWSTGERWQTITILCVQPSHQPISTTSATSLPISMEMANWVHGAQLTVQTIS